MSSSNDSSSLEDRKLEASDIESVQRSAAGVEPAAAAAATGSAPPKRTVTLNVSGQRFEATIEELTKEQPTFFSLMFSESFASPFDENGEVAIDQDPRYFGIVLAHLQGKNVMSAVRKLDKVELEQLKAEVEFYAIESLLKFLQRTFDIDAQRTASSLAVIANAIDGSVMLRKTSGGNFQYANNFALGDRVFSAGTHEWTVRIDVLQETPHYPYWIGLGVCKLDDMLPLLHVTPPTDTRWAANEAKSSRKQFFGKSSCGYEQFPGCILPESQKHMGRSWSSGTVVNFRLDCDAGELVVDDLTIGVPKHQDLYPVFILEHEGNQCTLL